MELTVFPEMGPEARSLDRDGAVGKRRRIDRKVKGSDPPEKNPFYFFLLHSTSNARPHYAI